MSIEPNNFFVYFTVLKAGFRKSEYFLTTDDKLLKKSAKTKELIVINPVNFIPIFESM